MILLSKESKKVFDELKARPQTINDLNISTGYTNRSLAQYLSFLRKQNLIEHNTTGYFTLSNFGIEQANK